MKVLYLHQYFHTPLEPGGTRSYWISQELVHRGNEVIMLTETNKHHPEATEVEVDGIKVIYLKNDYDNGMAAGARMRSFVNFMFKAIARARRIKDVDLVFATSTPLTIGAIALWLKWTKGWKYVFEVRDLWPEALIQGGLKNKPAIWMLKILEKKTYRNAERIIALSPGMKDGVLAIGIPDDKCAVVPNMSKPDKFYPHERSVKIMKEFSIDPTKFNLVHFGSMGQLNGLEYIIRAAEYAQKKGEGALQFLFLGAGSTLPALQEMVREKNLKNVKFLGNHPMDIVSEIVNCCDASITSFRNLPILATNSPNKLFDSLSAGKVIIVNSNGWTKELVEKYECGFYVDPEKPEELVDRMILIKDNPDMKHKMEENSRKLSIEVFDKNILVRKVSDILESSYN